jgi:hypothetical protein
MSTQDIFNLTDSWNAGGTTFTAIKMGVTDTASAAGSLLIDLQVGGSSKFKVAKTGSVTIVGEAASALTFSGEAIYARTTGSTNNVAMLSQYGIRAASDVPIGWSNSTTSVGTQDVFLYRDAANTLAQRNSTTAQSFRVYNTYTDASNYERGGIDWTTNANALTISTSRAGTGSNRNIIISAANVTRIQTAGGAGWQVDGSANLTAMTDNSYDIGASGANRPRNIFFAGTISGNTFQVGSTAALQFGTTRARIKSPSGTNITLVDAPLILLLNPPHTTLPPVPVFVACPIATPAPPPPPTNKY